MKARYTYRFYPTPKQEQHLTQTFGCVRYVWNWALACKKQLYEETGERLSFAAVDKKLTVLKRQKETSFLSEVARVPLVQTLRELDKAYTKLFRGNAKHPQFRSKRHRQTACFTSASFTIEGTNQPLVKLAKQKEPLNIVWSRPLPSKPSSLTIIKESDDRYFVSFVVEINPKPLEKTNQVVGIDLGIKDLVAISNGWKSGNPKYFQKNLDKLAKEQRRLAKKQKGSANREKQRKKVARLHSRITDQRKDFLHKLSTDLVQRYDVICVESLAVKNMVKNRKLAQTIIDAGWGMFVNMLEYKCEWYGKELVKIDQWFPSTKTCSNINCGYVLDNLPLNTRGWTCPECNTYHDRDVNAAKNVLGAGMVLRACGEDVRPEGFFEAGGQTSEKQEVDSIVDL